MISPVPTTAMTAAHCLNKAIMLSFLALHLYRFDSSAKFWNIRVDEGAEKKKERERKGVSGGG